MVLATFISINCQRGPEDLNPINSSVKFRGSINICNVLEVETFSHWGMPSKLLGHCSFQVAKWTFNFCTQGRMASAGCPSALTCQTNPKKACRVCLGFGEGFGPYSFKQRNKPDCALRLGWVLQLPHMAEPGHEPFFWPCFGGCWQSCYHRTVYRSRSKSHTVKISKKWLSKEVPSVKIGRPCRLR